MYTPIQDVSAILFLTKFKLCTLASGRMTKVLVLALSVSELHITATDNVTIDAVNTTSGFSSRLIRHNVSTELALRSDHSTLLRTPASHYNKEC